MAEQKKQNPTDTEVMATAIFGSEPTRSQTSAARAILYGLYLTAPDGLRGINPERWPFLMDHHDN